MYWGFFSPLCADGVGDTCSVCFGGRGEGVMTLNGRTRELVSQILERLKVLRSVFETASVGQLQHDQISLPECQQHNFICELKCAEQP